MHLAEVFLSRAGSLEWLVFLDGLIVGRFGIVSDALDYASLLECDPRARLEAIAKAVPA